MKRCCITLTVVLLCCGSADGHADRFNLNGVAWMQTSGEYRALTLGAYTVARQNLDIALEDKTWTALPSQVPASSKQAEALEKLPPAVILDIDETVLSSLPFQAWLVRNDKPFSAQSWYAWVSEADAEAVPGALRFVNYAMEKGVTVFYLSNRACRGVLDSDADGQIGPGDEQVNLKAFTLSNLSRLGFLPQKNISNDEAVLLRSGTGADRREQNCWASQDKTARRESLSSRYRILLIMGDSLNDFFHYRTPRDGRSDEAHKASDPHRARWGRSWIVLPNPVYGPWEKRFHDAREPRSSDDIIRIKLDSLDTWR